METNPRGEQIMTDQASSQGTEANLKDTRDINHQYTVYREGNKPCNIETNPRGEHAFNDNVCSKGTQVNLKDIRDINHLSKFTVKVTK